MTPLCPGLSRRYNLVIGGAACPTRRVPRHRPSAQRANDHSLVAVSSLAHREWCAASDRISATSGTRPRTLCRRSPFAGWQEPVMTCASRKLNLERYFTNLSWSTYKCHEHPRPGIRSTISSAVTVRSGALGWTDTTSTARFGLYDTTPRRISISRFVTFSSASTSFLFEANSWRGQSWW